jgi:hydroxymethylpyrimidine/phosphomethylpyrimidine kinase
VQADLRTFCALRVHGTFAITALTAQNTEGVRHIEVATAESVRQQILAVCEDFSVAAMKTGMLASKEIVETVADTLGTGPFGPLVVDPVLDAQSEGVLLPREALATLKERLLPLATLLTPNLPEAEALLGRPIPEGMRELEIAARDILRLGVKAVLIKGGHAGGSTADDLFFDGAQFRVFTAPRIPTSSTHGTGCTLSAAITAYLARGASLLESIGRAKIYLTEALKGAVALGHGHGPLHHFHEFYTAGDSA